VKIRPIIESGLIGVVSMALSYKALISPATLMAISIRRKFPEAWFSGLINWYAAFIVLLLSIVVGGVACRAVYRHTMRSAA
jgi:NhaP-type Na+/H+ or K+/H+ antiporter